jgi:hypothetical protein
MSRTPTQMMRVATSMIAPQRARRTTGRADCSGIATAAEAEDEVAAGLPAVALIVWPLTIIAPPWPLPSMTMEVPPAASVVLTPPSSDFAAEEGLSVLVVVPFKTSDPAGA